METGTFKIPLGRGTVADLDLLQVPPRAQRGLIRASALSPDAWFASPPSLILSAVFLVYFFLSWHRFLESCHCIAPGRSRIKRNHPSPSIIRSLLRLYCPDGGVAEWRTGGVNSEEWRETKGSGLGNIDHHLTVCSKSSLPVSGMTISQGLCSRSR